MYNEHINTTRSAVFDAAHEDVEGEAYRIYRACWEASTEDLESFCRMMREGR